MKVMKIMSNKLTNYVIFLYFCAILFVFPISVDSTIIYLGTIFNILFILGIMFNMHRIKYSKKELIFICLIIIYLTFSMLNLIIIKQNYIIYVINKSIPMITFIFLIGLNNNHIIDMKKINKYVLIFTNFIIIASIILFLFGFSGIHYENGRIGLVTKNYYLDLFGETRMSWLFTHKSRFAAFCLMNIGLVILSDIKTKTIKFIFIFISLIDIYFSSNKTILILSIIALLFSFMQNNFKIKKLKMLLLSMLSFITIYIMWLFPRVIINLQKTRDVDSLGGRIYIWLAGIEKLKENPFGIGKFTEANWLVSSNLPGGVYTNAHNMFINEGIERGIFVGIIFVIMHFFIINMLEKSRIKYILISVILSAMMDNTLTSEITYIFWLLIFIYYNYLVEEKVKDTI